MFLSSHYAGPDFGASVQQGEPWKKVFGPVFVYLNSDSGKKHDALWENAKRQVLWINNPRLSLFLPMIPWSTALNNFRTSQYLVETAKWPYDFPMSNDFPASNERGSITGRLLIRDRYLLGELPPTGVAHVGLAPLGPAGSWQTDAKVTTDFLMSSVFILV